MLYLLIPFLFYLNNFACGTIFNMYIIRLKYLRKANCFIFGRRPKIWWLYSNFREYLPRKFKIIAHAYCFPIFDLVILRFRKFAVRQYLSFYFAVRQYQRHIYSTADFINLVANNYGREILIGCNTNAHPTLYGVWTTAIKEVRI